jgi:hypothetical protein
MAATYTPLATNTLASNATSLSFTGISGSYKNLIVVANFKSLSAGYGFSIQINDTSLTAYNYMFQYLTGFGSGTGNGYGVPGNPQAAWGMMYNGAATGSYDATAIVQLPFYSNASYPKSANYRAGSSDYYEVTSGYATKNNTAAITGIRISPDAWNTRTSFASGSTFTIYGVA